MANEYAAAKPLIVGTAPQGDVVDRLILALIFIGVGIIAFIVISGGLAQALSELTSQHSWTSVLVHPSLLWVSMGMLLLLIRTVLWARYKPCQASTMEEAPSLTIIIPAYNEGAMVAKSIDSCAMARYPASKLEIIVVDDGSKDDTWVHIQAAAQRYPDVVRTIRLPQNRGKRAALAEGIRCARGEVFITIDSDSMIETDALLAITGPFREKKVGGVAGKVCVLNRFDGLLPRMLHVRFVLSFDFLRSVQSSYGTVYCCPGAFSAYRREAVLAVLDKWENQTFLGARCAIGEDRALTNDILALGYNVVYQRSAAVHTIAPESYGKLCKMYLRWDRSYVREELRLFGIIWKRNPLSLCMTILEKTMTNLRYPVAYAALVMLFMHAIQDPWTIVRVLISIGVASAFYMLYYLRSERSWEFVYGIVYAYFSFFSLMWIFPYALCTARKQGWLTR